MPPKPTGHPLLFNGLLFGAILAAVGLADSLIQWLTGGYDVTASTSNGITTVNVFESGPAGLLGCVVFLVTLGLTFVAGMLAARRTGRVGTGALAGLIAGAGGALIGSGAGLVIILVVIAPNVQAPADSTLTPGQVQALLIGTALVRFVLVLLLDGGVGAAMGALGGLVGQNTYRKAAMASYPTPYPWGMPGQPGGAWPPPPYPYPPQYPPYPPQFPPYHPPYPPQPDSPPPPQQ